MTTSISELTEQEAMLYEAIKINVDDDGVCRRSTKELGRACHISKSEVPKLKKSLAKKEWIILEKIIYEDGAMEPDNIHVNPLQSNQRL